MSRYSFCEKFPDVCNNIVQETGSDFDTVSEAITEYFDDILMCSGLPTMPTVNCGKMFKWKPEINKLRSSLCKRFYKYHQGAISEEDMREYVSWMWPIYRREIVSKQNYAVWDDEGWWKKLQEDLKKNF